MKSFFKKILTFCGFLALSFSAFGFSASIDGKAQIAEKGQLPSGLFAKTAGYLPGDSIHVTNSITGETIQLLVLGAIDGNDGVAMILSQEAALRLGILGKENPQVLLSKREGVADKAALGSGLIAYTQTEVAKEDSSAESSAASSEPQIMEAISDEAIPELSETREVDVKPEEIQEQNDSNSDKKADSNSAENDEGDSSANEAGESPAVPVIVHRDVEVTSEKVGDDELVLEDKDYWLKKEELPEVEDESSEADSSSVGGADENKENSESNTEEFNNGYADQAEEPFLNREPSVVALPDEINSEEDFEENSCAEIQKHSSDIVASVEDDLTLTDGEGEKELSEETEQVEVPVDRAASETESELDFELEVSDSEEIDVPSEKGVEIVEAPVDFSERNLSAEELELGEMPVEGIFRDPEIVVDPHAPIAENDIDLYRPEPEAEIVYDPDYALATADLCRKEAEEQEESIRKSLDREIVPEVVSGEEVSVFVESESEDAVRSVPATVETPKEEDQVFEKVDGLEELEPLMPTSTDSFDILKSSPSLSLDGDHGEDFLAMADEEDSEFTSSEDGFMDEDAFEEPEAELGVAWEPSLSKADEEPSLNLVPAEDDESNELETDEILSDSRETSGETTEMVDDFEDQDFEGEDFDASEVGLAAEESYEPIVLSPSGNVDSHESIGSELDASHTRKDVTGGKDISDHLLSGEDDLDKSKIYIQIATMSKESAITDLLEKYAKYPIVLIKNAGKDYRILIGPLNEDEYGTVMVKFKAFGFRDCFIKK